LLDFVVSALVVKTRSPLKPAICSGNSELYESFRVFRIWENSKYAFPDVVAIPI
jgi:hypothetical protein